MYESEAMDETSLSEKLVVLKNQRWPRATPINSITLNNSVIITADTIKYRLLKVDKTERNGKTIIAIVH